MEIIASEKKVYSFKHPDYDILLHLEIKDRGSFTVCNLKFDVMDYPFDMEYDYDTLCAKIDKNTGNVTFLTNNHSMLHFSISSRQGWTGWDSVLTYSGNEIRINVKNA